MPYDSFKNMPVWEQAMDVAVRIFELTDNLPRREDYGLTSQIRRSGLSISGNIAEGFGRNHTKDKVNFYYIARGSATETQSHLEYSKRVGYVKQANADTLDSQLGTLIHDLNKIIHALSSKP